MKRRSMMHYLSFAPRGRDEAEHFFTECTRLKREGSDIRVAILESPFVRDPRSEYSGGITACGTVDRFIESIKQAGPGGPHIVLVEHGGMNRIEEVSRKDHLAVVDGGAPYRTLARTVEDAGMYFPVEPEFAPEDLTIAGLCMDGTITGTEGCFGRLREHVLSIELVTPAGDVIYTGSRAIKDVTGYEVAGFILGSGGLCGMITKVTLRLRPRPGTRTRFAMRGNLEALQDSARTIFEMLRPASLTLFEGGTARAVSQRLRGSFERAVGAVPSGEDSPLLVGELQAPARGMDGRLIDKLESLHGGGISFLVIPDIPDCAPENLFRGIVEYIGEGDGVIHVSFDGGQGPVDPGGVPFFRSLYPGRVHALLPCGGRCAADGALEPWLDEAGGLDELLLNVHGKGLRLRLEALVISNGALNRRRIHPDELENILGRAGPGAGATSQNRALDDISAKILKNFDPAGIMFP